MLIIIVFKMLISHWVYLLREASRLCPVGVLPCKALGSGNPLEASKIRLLDGEALAYFKAVRHVTPRYICRSDGDINVSVQQTQQQKTVDYAPLILNVKNIPVPRFSGIRAHVQ
jgi:hypothetical protein